MYRQKETGAGCGLMSPITRQRAEDCPVFHVDADVRIARTVPTRVLCAGRAGRARTRRSRPASLPRDCGRTSHAAVPPGGVLTCEAPSH
jgi:hypothetical protein